MRAAVLGGGMQGCCVALALAARGVKVTVFERQQSLLRGAASNNEGKIHLGYVYAADPSFATARILIRGALAFLPFLRTHLETSAAIVRSSPFLYIVHRDSQLSLDQIETHFEAVGAEISAADRKSYFGQTLHATERLSQKALERKFDTSSVLACYQTPEIAIDPHVLCAAIKDRVAEDPNIDIRFGADVQRVLGEAAPYRIEVEPADRAESFDVVTNALWDGRIAVDIARGMTPPRQWLHRIKYGFRFRAPEMTDSTTIMLGSFGDTVSYQDGTRYLSWYPAGMRMLSTDIQPPRLVLNEGDLEKMRAASFAGIGGIVPEIGRIAPDRARQAKACGGVITAWAKTDIDDPNSELHERSAIGVASDGGYHSIDTGKFTMAPYFADACVERILGPRS